MAPSGPWPADQVHRDRERNRDRDRDREGDRKRERERERAYGALTPMFELSTCYVSASWCTMNSCMARIGEQGMLLGFRVP